MKKSYTNIIFGICVALFGIALLCKYTGLVDFTMFFDGWWTLFLIIPGITGLFNKDGRFFSLTLLIAGVVLYLGVQGIIPKGSSWDIIIASLIIIFGINIIYSNIKMRKEFDNVEANSADKDARIENYVAIFGGKKEKYSNAAAFIGASLTAIFGGIELDLRDAKIDKDVKINAIALFGGCNIYIPQNVNVKSGGASIFGGTDNKIGVVNDDYPTIYVNSTALFGGVSIK